MTIQWFVLAALPLVGAGCMLSHHGRPQDGSGEAETTIVEDASSETGDAVIQDGAEIAIEEDATDTVEDTAPEIGPDVFEAGDAGDDTVDVAMDVPTDVPVDVPVDVPADVQPDVQPDVPTVDAMPDAGGPNLEIVFTDDPGNPIIRGLLIEVIPGGLDPPTPSLQIASCTPPIVAGITIRCLVAMAAPLNANVRVNPFYTDPTMYPQGQDDLVCHTTGSRPPACPRLPANLRVFYRGTEILRTTEYPLGSLLYAPWGGPITFLSFRLSAA